MVLSSEWQHLGLVLRPGEGEIVVPGVTSLAHQLSGTCVSGTVLSLGTRGTRC